MPVAWLIRRSAAHNRHALSTKLTDRGVIRVGRRQPIPYAEEFARKAGRHTAGQQPSLVQYAHAIAQLKRFLRVMRGQDDSAPALAYELFAQERSKLARRDRVQASRGFVEQEKPGPREQRSRNQQPLEHAAGELAD